jgi:D-alanine--poly(phosphoribitol) ligase subunit 2
VAIDQALLMQNVRQLSGMNGEATPDMPLFSSGALDSLAMLNLITLIEERAGFEIRADEVTLENFDTVNRILSFAESRGA